MDIQQIAANHAARGGKFVMGSDTKYDPGDVVPTIAREQTGEILQHPFVVVGPATFRDAVENRPIEVLGTPIEDSDEYYYFIEPGD